MDTLTQMTLGAAVGEAALGKRAGNKAILWGSVAGALPDLDILAGPFLDPVSKMAFHRGMTHSLTFSLLLAPLLGYLIYSIYRRRSASWKEWTLLAFLALVTHPLLDIFTTYGTQFLWPFSDHRFAWSTIFVIDPLYSFPMMFNIAAILISRRISCRRKIVNYIGIAISSAYLIFTVMNKAYITHQFAGELDRQKVEYSRLITSPTPFNNILWRGVAESREGYWEGFYSWFDGKDSIHFQFTSKNHRALAHLAHHPVIRKLVWLTNGFYTVETADRFLQVNDMRYGRLNNWGKLEGEYVFSFTIFPDEVSLSGQPRVIREKPALKLNLGLVLQLGRRLLGN